MPVVHFEELIAVLVQYSVKTLQAEHVLNRKHFYRLLEAIELLLLLKNLSEALEHEASVVIFSSRLLNFDLYRIETALENFFKVFLLQSHEFMSDQLLLDIAFYDAPQCFDRVQLRTVRRQEHQYEVQVFGKLRYILRVVAWMIV